VGVTGTGVVVLADNPTILQAKFGNGAGNGHVHFRRGNTPGGLTDNATLAFLSATKTMSLEFELDGFQSQFLFAATASRVYTFPNLTGTVALTANPASFTTLTATTSTTLGVIGPGGTTGNLILLNQSSGFSTTIRAGVATGNATYTLPLDVPTANGYILSSTTGGVMSWVPLSGVADGTYGQVEVTVSGTIWTPINLDAGTVNNFATVQGPVILANTAGVVQQPSWSDPADVTQVLTVFQGTSAVATARGLVPAPTLITDIGKFLRADGTWQTVTGSGDMVLASAQRNTGIKTFAPGSLIIQQGGVGTPGTILASNATGSNKTATFQDATGIVPFLGLGQTWTAAQLFNSGFLQLRNAGNTQTTTIAGGTTAGSYTLTIPAITANDTFTVLGLAQTFAAKKTVQYVQATANTGTFSVVNQDTGTQTQLGIDVTLNGTGTNVSSRMGLWTVWNTSMVGSGTLGNNWNFMVARNTANNNTWLISNTGNVYPTAFSVGMPAGFYFGNQSLTDGVLRATANYWYRYFLDISPETGNTITAGSTELVVTGYTKFASRTGVFVIPGVTVTNPYIGHFTECFAPNNGNSATVTAPRIGTAQWAYTQGTNITIPHTGGLFGHFNEYNTQAGSNPTTFTSLNQLAIWHFNNTSSSSIGAVVTGLKIYRTVGGGNVQSKAAIYIDNQTSTASILNPRLNTNVTTGQTYTNPPWSIFAEADKAAFGGGILIKSSPALSDALTSTWLSIGAGTTAKSQINLATSTAPTTPVDGDIWFDGTNLKIRVSGATYTLTKTP
jgi:hypothetical protein